MLPIYAAAIYDQNALLTAKGFEPINLKSVMIGELAFFSFSSSLLLIKLIYAERKRCHGLVHVCIFNKESFPQRTK